MNQITKFILIQIFSLNFALFAYGFRPLMFINPQTEPAPFAQLNPLGSATLVIGLGVTNFILTFRNNGTLATSTITTTKTGSNRFSIATDNCNGTTLNAGAQCNIQVNFNNSGGGPNNCYTGTFIVNATTGGTAQISVTGEGNDNNGSSDCGTPGL
jgi:hypothetical protein